MVLRFVTAKDTLNSLRYSVRTTEMSNDVTSHHFYRAMLRRARYCYGKLFVRLFVCLSVTLRYCDYIGWKSSKIISWLVSLGCSLFFLFEIFARIGVGC